MNPRRIILASTSVYRKQLLDRLAVPYECARPDVDEMPLPDEPPAATAERLAKAKAEAVAGNYPDALIIGSDQVAHRGAERFGKPGSLDKAVLQLKNMRGSTVVFHTALCLLDARTANFHLEGIPTEVRFRDLGDEEILRYVEKEKPIDCAGSAKAESLGITLLESIRGDDPTALVGLPLIALSRMLRAEGVILP